MTSKNFFQKSLSVDTMSPWREKQFRYVKTKSRSWIYDKTLHCDNFHIFRSDSAIFPKQKKLYKNSIKQ